MAAVWGVEKFRIFLLGIPFELETDNRSLLSILKPKSMAPGRTERWVLRLQPYTYKVIHKPGKQNIADPISRLLQIEDSIEEFDDNDEHIYLNAVLDSVAVDVKEIQDQIESDPLLKLVRDAILNDKWDDPQLKDFSPYQESLSVIGDFVVRGCQLVIPTTLRERLLLLAHEGHPGETAMSQRLRCRVWWPGMDKQAREKVKKCTGCQLVSRPSVPEPMRRRKMPDEPWADLALDYLGPLPSSEYLLVVIDYYSRFKEIRVTKRITATDTIQLLEPIFASNGYPRTLTLDNARQFISSEFKEYCKERNILLNHTAPYWPQANGEVERQNSSLLKRLRISHAMGRDWKADMLEYLVMYNSTPHAVTGKTPCELLNKRQFRSKIPSIGDVVVAPPPTSEVQDRDAVEKMKGKERADEKRRAKMSDIVPGDTVRMQNLLPQNKLATTFTPQTWTVLDKVGSRTTIQNDEDKSIMERNSKHLKKVPTELRDPTVEDQPPGKDSNPPITSQQPLATSTPVVMPKRSSRTTHKPKRLDDFVP